MKDQPSTIYSSIWTQPLPPLGQWPGKLAGCLGLQGGGTQAGRGAVQRRRRRRAHAAEPVAADEWPRVCGWFGSSHELNSGLLVQELTLDETPSGSPLISLSGQ